MQSGELKLFGSSMQYANNDQHFNDDAIKQDMQYISFPYMLKSYNRMFDKLFLDFSANINITTAKLNKLAREHRIKIYADGAHGFVDKKYAHLVNEIIQDDWVLPKDNPYNLLYTTTKPVDNFLFKALKALNNISILPFTNNERFFIPKKMIGNIDCVLKYPTHTMTNTFYFKTDETRVMFKLIMSGLQ